MKLLGCAVLMTGCAAVVVAPEPYACPDLTEEIIAEYEDLVNYDAAPGLRAWVREADRVCRANEELRDEQ